MWMWKKQFRVKTWAISFWQIWKKKKSGRKKKAVLFF